ncbi:ArsR family transcriptional regulator [Actinoplanes regularis]|uniref:arsenate reductase/protein-tyrosine-phosphatase family protein n=1 Tax=Actinoplanes regularis TaxID=52697 RepID=UPI0024A4BDC7|nr:ArsR family transcriptional regulator [Actinoplanes regularis]GLW35493.1 ArsR family transcriptional regulator [Actinoplanes regularis]
MERAPLDAAVTPPEFLKLAGHPVRWRLLGELARSDRQVHELTGLVKQPQNLVSYHLGKLRAGRLVTTRRSSADRRDTYYTVDLAHCGELLASTGAALHPALHLVPPTPAVVMHRRGPGLRVLFLCTGNSARSQIAEALLQHLSAGSVMTFSAGSHPKQLHPDAIRVMAEHGIDLSGHRAKHLDEFNGQRFTAVVTLCDRVREICPEFPGHPDSVHWSIPDPAGDPNGYPAFQRLTAELRTRIEFLLHRLVFTPT